MKALPLKLGSILIIPLLILIVIGGIYQYQQRKLPDKKVVEDEVLPFIPKPFTYARKHPGRGGKVYLLEYRAEDPDVPIKTLHKMTEAQSIAEMNAVGLRHVRTEHFLPWQHFMVFEK